MIRAPSVLPTSTMIPLVQVSRNPCSSLPAPCSTQKRVGASSNEVPKVSKSVPCAAAVKVITGSIQGVLRVHQPHQQGYHIEDILLEAQLDSSILQLAAGNFLGYVLQPCCLQAPVPDHHQSLSRLHAVRQYSSPAQSCVLVHPPQTCVHTQGFLTGPQRRTSCFVTALVLPAEGPVYA